ncbi:acetate kinase [Burkholderia ubonensis]|uniref:acetate kinase n=1 Tax=Burkholderia ubonensis TaxID=101571 RepID=UPI00075CEA90|nr:acetate kinase [Burkholderia ubonensis]KVO42751.1 acetate kinase [Burkholderia ubonensis]KVP33348.1 acetate kinase [Burkholderia ubonensis]KWD08329.1 acetate kinase [Burkholderia ubonensis]KWD24380.1 acetate kinase [Burkholderia ubonensis]KWO99506.1 acetate kinase [Burkholderia ubonensis]
MKRMPFRHIRAITYASVLLFQAEAHAQSLDAQSTQENISALRQEVDHHLKELDALKRKLADEEANLARLSRALDNRELAAKRGAGPGDTGGTAPTDAGAASTGGAMTAGAPSPEPSPGNVQSAATPAPSQPVGQAPVPDTAPPPVAPIFDQPGVLTPKHKFVVEPSFQFGYSSSNRVALVGYTIIPALLIGLVDVREVKTTTLTAAVAARYGITNRMEVEVRIPYVYSTNDTVSREIFTGSAQDNAFNSHGKGLGDVEMTLRYQFNTGGPDQFYYIGWLRFKTATGKSPFDVVTDCVTRCVGNTTGTGLPLEQPTGSGFYAIQPGLTWLFPSDPVVFFGNVSYLHSFGRDNLSLTIRNGQKDFVGSVQPGDIWGFNIGMGLALNEKASVSLGYDQSIVLPTKENGQTVPGSVRVILGTLLVGYSYRLSPKTTLNLSIGAGLTRDTPDVAMTLRVPIAF